MVLSKIRNAARTLLTLEEKDPKRMFEGEALMRRMYKYGLLNESQVSQGGGALTAVSLLSFFGTAFSAW
jgi:hypothetical protein